jgi:Fe2+ or Zn2+ uptake regulation protein
MYEDDLNLLKQRHLKVTPQRLQILHYLHTHHTHPDADEIYTALKRTNPSLSRTTVYNSLETLKKEDLIHAITIKAGETRYDAILKPHHHFLCTSCKKISDIELICPNIKKVEGGGYCIQEVHGYFKGICPTCKHKQEQKDESKDVT